MTSRFVVDKWRPTLGMVVYAVLTTVAVLPFAVVTVLGLTKTGTDGAIGMGSLLLGCLVVAIVTFAVGFVFLRTITRPVSDLAGRMSAISRGDRDAIAPIAQCGTVEIADLADRMLTMSEALSLKSDTVRTLAADLSHEFKSPLTAIQGATELLKDSGSSMPDADRERFLDNIAADAERLTLLLARLRELALVEAPIDRGSVTLATVIGDLSERGVPADIRLEDGVQTAIGMSRKSAGIVFSHLIDNAAKHDATTITIRAALEERAGDTVRIVVSDNGSGISPHDRDRVFEAFFTTRRDTGGTGMGLNIVQSLLQAHGGSIRPVDCADGAAFEVVVPVAL